MAEVVNPQVGAILDRSCQDCHSDHTNWPGRAYVPPQLEMEKAFVR